MVAYSFKGRFVAPVRIGLGLPVLDEHYELGGYAPGSLIRPKNQTIRAQGPFCGVLVQWERADGR